MHSEGVEFFHVIFLYLIACVQTFLVMSEKVIIICDVVLLRCLFLLVCLLVSVSFVWHRAMEGYGN